MKYNPLFRSTNYGMDNHAWFHFRHTSDAELN